MLTVLATSVIVMPATGESVVGTYGRVCYQIQSQIEALISDREPNADLTWTGEVTWHSSALSMALDWKSWEPPAGDARLTVCRVAYPGKEHTWEAELRIGLTEGAQGVDISATWSRSAVTDLAYPLSRLPPLLERLESESCHSSDLGLPFSFQRLTANDVHDFCASTLLSTERRVPLILISPERREQRALLDAAKLARQVFGLAVVYQLANDDAVEAFRTVIGDALACYDGAVRLYWPVAGRPMQHPYRTAGKIRDLGSREIDQWLFQCVARASRSYFEVIPSLRNLEQRQRQDERRQLLEAIAGKEVDINDLEQIWQSALEERNRLEERNKELEEQVQRLDLQVRDLQAELEGKNEALVAIWKSGSTLPEMSPITESDQPVLLLSKTARETLWAASPKQHSEFVEELQRLCSKPELRCSHSEQLGKKKSDCRIFPQGDKPIRIFWFEQDEGRIHVCELGDHRDKSYERLIERGVHKRNYPLDDFVPLDIFATAMLS